MKGTVEFILPLLNQITGADNQAALEVAAGDQLFDQQPGHNRLPGAGIVSQQKAQRLPRQHHFVDGGNLMGKRLHQRGMHRQQRIEQMRKTDTMRLGHQPKERAVAVETPRAPLIDQGESGFVGAEEQLVGDSPIGIAVDQRDCIGAMPLNAHDRDRRIGKDAAEERSRLNVFESYHRVICACRGCLQRQRNRRALHGRARSVNDPAHNR